MDKATLRKQMQAKRAALTPALVQEKSVAICAHLLPLVQGFDVVAGYVPMKSEVDISPLLLSLQSQGKTIALPRVDASGSMGFHVWEQGAALSPDAWGVLSASGARVEPTCVIAPLLAFNNERFRLGYGGGFYDRAIAALRTAHQNFKAYGAAYSFQATDMLTVEPHDAHLDAIATEIGVIS